MLIQKSDGIDTGGYVSLKEGASKYCIVNSALVTYPYL